jgi:uncharacterized protein GlcG (DUF336 family)
MRDKATRVSFRGGAGVWGAALLGVWVASRLPSVGVSAGPRAPALAAADAVVPLTIEDVRRVVESAAAAIADRSMAIAVVDRAGRMLAVYRKSAATADAAEEALGLARTGAFFAHDEAPLSSRTVRYISGVHFPPLVQDTPNAPLYGIENTNRGCDLNVAYNTGKEFPRATAIDGVSLGRGIVTGKQGFDLTPDEQRAVNPGGVPIYKEGADGSAHVVGGVGVSGVAPVRAEYAAFAGSVRGEGTFLRGGRPCTRLVDPTRPFGPRPAAPGALFVDGIALPFVENLCLPPGAAPGAADGSFIVGPAAGGLAPDGYLAGPAGSAELTVDDAQRIIANAVATAARTRAAIRLPLDRRTRMVIAVADRQGSVLGLFRMVDSTVFSIDVAVTKARNVVYFSGPERAPADLPGVPIGTAVTSRTIGFGAQPFFPPGIHNTQPGPFFPLFQFDTANPCTQGMQPANPHRSGIVFFAGSAPLYKNGALVGGLGVSGDGVDQDDYVTAGGAAGFEAPPDIRADRVLLRGVRLPYLKFPRNPEK